tara:strand:+ start:506 stop:694 length:189 start_codon:yes stop_codon:yes gene_type:complete
MAEVTVEVKVKRGEKIEKSLRILKRKMAAEGIFDTIKDKRFHISNTEKRKEKAKRKRWIKNG